MKRMSAALLNPDQRNKEVAKEKEAGEESTLELTCVPFPNYILHKCSKRHMEKPPGTAERYPNVYIINKMFHLPSLKQFLQFVFPGPFCVFERFQLCKSSNFPVSI